MKTHILFSLVALVLACSSKTALSDESSEIIESTILWKAKLKPDGTPIKMSKLLSDPSKFEKTGNFYKAKSELKVFGQKVKYLGMIGIDLIPGPNATLEGSPEDIAEYISKNYKLKFKSSEDKSAYQADVKKDVKLIIEKHPNLENASMVIGAYFGP